MNYERKEAKGEIVRAYKNGKKISAKKPIQAQNGDRLKLTVRFTHQLEEA